VARVWIAGRQNTELGRSSSWTLLGVFEEHRDAEMRCSRGSDFVAPIELNSDLPVDHKDWPSLQYPFRLATAQNDPRLKHLNDPIESLKLSTRARNCLRKAGIKEVRQLASCGECDLYHIEGCGRGTIQEIKFELKQVGLSLHTKIDEFGCIVWPPPPREPT